MSDIESRIKHVIAELMGVATVDIKPTAKFVEDFDADSLDEIELVMAIEDEFEFEISDDDAEQIKTVQQAIDYVTANAPK